MSARVSNVSLAQNNSDLLASDYQRLSALTYIYSDASSIVQLKRISRDIYDHLAEHLGEFLYSAFVTLEPNAALRVFIISGSVSIKTRQFLQIELFRSVLVRILALVEE